MSVPLRCDLACASRSRCDRARCHMGGNCGGATRSGPGTGANLLRNWKMATEGGGRHSPSTVVWEEEGVLEIVQSGRQKSIGPKVMDSEATAPSPGQMNVRLRHRATRGWAP